MTTLYFFLAVVCGMLVAFEPGMNATMRSKLGNPVHSAIVSFTVGLVALVVAALVINKPFVGMKQALTAPWWAWGAGLVGAAFVATAAGVAHQLSATLFTIAVIAAQGVLAVVIDHYALVGFERHPITPGRICGVVLVIAGVVLVHKF